MPIRKLLPRVRQEILAEKWVDSGYFWFLTADRLCRWIGPGDVGRNQRWLVCFFRELLGGWRDAHGRGEGTREALRGNRTRRFGHLKFRDAFWVSQEMHAGEKTKSR